MRRRVKTIAAGLTLVISGVTAGLVAGAGTAAAAEPILIGDCSTTVEGAPGTPISLKVSAVLDPIVSIADPLGLLGLRKTLTNLPAIPIGAISTANSTISGQAIAAKVVNSLPLGSVVLAPVTSKLASLCGVTTKVLNTVVAPVQDGAATVGKTIEQGAAALPQLPNLIPGIPGIPGVPNNPGTNPGTTPGTGGNPQTGGGNTGGGGGTTTPGGTTGTIPGVDGTVIGGLPTGGLPLYGSGLNFGRSAMTDYSSIPFAQAGLFSPSPGVRYGGAVPGYSPQFGILGTGDSDGVQAAGHAEALDPVGGNRVALPVLLAVLVLSGVTAALVRTWVLRRTVS
ncbi:hypothetical protein [Actinokineospora sp. NBRC 105648]|uniref:hypothetical protein n=1 Tax=Actinokineospora sp. NBRC 105648 TaxID=3032206 RepID=UPI0024A40CE3|nr:hypothetical protein [Actinokineospora sp. NBRC 105648]GLZ37440.1 hypothetical protein Acsp05_10650 [Actinokineospora sp. NBRC 105648]